MYLPSGATPIPHMPLLAASKPLAAEKCVSIPLKRVSRPLTLLPASLVVHAIATTPPTSSQLL